MHNKTDYQVYYMNPINLLKPKTKNRLKETGKNKIKQKHFLIKPIRKKLIGF